MTNTEQIAAMAERIEKLERALLEIIDMDISKEVLRLVVCWSGDGQYSRHPERLGASIDTTCGAVYALAGSLALAEALLSSGDQG